MTEESGGEPPCFAHLLEPDETTRRDVARWRKAERARLIAARQAIPVAARQAADARLAERLSERLAPLAGRCIALYWPFRGEPDLRRWAAACREAGAEMALPAVVGKAQPLVFRDWQADTALERGVWDILAPPATAAERVPDIVISPVVGVDAEGYRLGYGGGFYDRTLAALRAAGHDPLVLGVGYDIQRVPSIFPLPHDVAMGETILVPVAAP